MQVVSLNIGEVKKRIDRRGRTRETAIDKQPTHEPVALTRTGFVGDGSAYRSRAAGDTAVHAFCRETYQALEEKAGQRIAVPTFGENLTIAGYTEHNARPGDIVRVGQALLQVTQPVVRCSWPATIGGIAQVSRWATEANTPGTYWSVLEGGPVQIGDTLSLEQASQTPWTIASLAALLRQRPVPEREALEVLALPTLADRWKHELRKALRRPSATP